MCSILFGTVTAIIVEIYALNTGLWTYNKLMPIVPLVNTGLTPTVQLGILSYFVLGVVKRIT